MDTIDAMQGALATLRQRLATDTDYFRRVYNYTFEFSRPPGQRSLGASLLSPSPFIPLPPPALSQRPSTLPLSPRSHLLSVELAALTARAALDMAQGFWQILIPHGLAGGALAHVAAGAQDDDGDAVMDAGAEEGWRPEHTQWWFEFLERSGSRGVSKDVWQMVSARAGSGVDGWTGRG